MPHNYLLQEIVIDPNYLNELRSIHTRSAYEHELNRFFSWTQKNSNEIDALIVLDYITELSKSLKPTSVNRALTVIRAYYDWMIENGQVTQNPARKVKKVRTDHASQTKVKWLTSVEEQRLLLTLQIEKDERKRIRDEAMISLMLYAGLRVSEVVSLKMEDVDISRGRGVLTIREGKGGVWRTVPISDKLRKVLRAWSDVRSQYDKSKGSPYVFVSLKAGYTTRYNLDDLVKKYLARVGIVGHSCHSLRHTFAKRLAEAGVRLEEIAKLCGHANISTTMIYTAPGAEELRYAVNKI